MLDKFRETAITWDKANRKVYEPLRVSAGDNKGRKLSVQVVNGGVIESLSGASLSLFWETKDKAYKGLDAFTAVDATKGEFEIYYTTGMLSNEGTLNANLVLVDTSGRIVSEPFTIAVFKGIDDDAIQSSDSFTALTEALAQVGTINNKADKDELLALESIFEQNKVSVDQQLQHTVRVVNVLAYGVVGDGITDDTYAIRNAYATVKKGDTFYFPPDFDFRITDTLIFDNEVHIDMWSPITFDSEQSKPAIIVGSVQLNTMRELHHRLRVRRKNFTSWKNLQDIGIVVQNQMANFVDIIQAQKFTVGVKFIGDGVGFSYTQIRLNDLTNNKIHVVLSSKNNGYVNENLFIGGRIANFGTETPDQDDKIARRGIVIESEDGTYPRNNNNVFLKPSLENEGGIGVEIKDGLVNKFIGARGEFLAHTVKWGTNARNNQVDFLYTTPGTSERAINESDNGTNVVKFGRFSDVNESKRVIVDRNNLSDNAVIDGTNVEVAGCSFIQVQSTGYAPRIKVPVSSVSTSADLLLATSYAVGVMLDTADVKKFTAQVSYANDSNHWMFVRCFDAAGNVLSDTQTNVLGGGRVGEYFDHPLAYGFQAFRTAEKAKHVTFEIEDKVKKIWVGFGHNSLQAKLKGFQILTSENGNVRVSRV